MSNTTLTYSSPTTEYMSGLPYGGRSIAAMALCSGTDHRIALNHEALWRANYANRTCRESADNLPLVRELLLKRDFESATALSHYYFGGGGGGAPFGVKKHVDPYQPAGDLIIRAGDGEFTSYRRTLELDKAVFTADYTKNNINYSIESFTDINSGTLAAKLTSSVPSDAEITLTRIEDPDCTITYVHRESESSFTMTGRFPEGVVFTVFTKIITNGTISAVDKGYSIRNASNTDIFLTISLTETPIKPQSLLYSDLLASHTAKFSEMFSRCRLELDGEESNLDTDERVKAFRAGGEPLVPLLYFNFGRYLMLCGSTGELPLNLQGKWNDELRPPWDADYHNNINLQMNYWFAEELNMPECHEVLIDFILRMADSGREAAKKLYGCRGIYISQTTDASARITPEAYGYAVWVGAAPWFCAHLMKHYDYTLNKEYLLNKAYPFMKDSALFFEDYLYDVNGTLEIMPSQSPENSFVECNNKGGISACISSAMDVELVTELLQNCIRAAQILGIDEDKISQWKIILSKLAKVKIGSDGRRLEWGEELTEAEPEHRHISHLYGLHPSALFKPGDELYKAAELSLDTRLAYGGGHTGWSRSWVSCCMARLGRGADSYEHLRELICEFATVSLLDLHPPRIFQIDGNMGGTSAVCELLFRSCYGKIELLPSINGLPNEWQSGKLYNVCAEGGFTVSFEWKNGKVTWYEVSSIHGGECIVNDKKITIPSGETVRVEIQQ